MPSRKGAGTRAAYYVTPAPVGASRSNRVSATPVPRRREGSEAAYGARSCDVPGAACSSRSKARGVACARAWKSAMRCA